MIYEDHQKNQLLTLGTLDVPPASFCLQKRYIFVVQATVSTYTEVLLIVIHIYAFCNPYFAELPPIQAARFCTFCTYPVKKFGFLGKYPCFLTLLYLYATGMCFLQVFFFSFFSQFRQLGFCCIFFHFFCIFLSRILSRFIKNVIGNRRAGFQ